MKNMISPNTGLTISCQFISLALSLSGKAVEWALYIEIVVHWYCSVAIATCFGIVLYFLFFVLLFVGKIQVQSYNEHFERNQIAAGHVYVARVVAITNVQQKSISLMINWWSIQGILTFNSYSHLHMNYTVGQIQSLWCWCHLSQLLKVIRLSGLWCTTSY